MINNTCSNSQLQTTERIMAELWRDVLQLTDLPGASDDFFDLGGDSITMVTLLQLVDEEFSAELAPSALLRAPSLRELAALVELARESQLQTHGI